MSKPELNNDAARRVQSLLAWLFIGIMAIAIGVLIWARLSPSQSLPTETEDHSEVTIVVPDVQKGELTYRSERIPVPEGQSAYTLAFEELIKKSREFPSGTTLLSAKRENDLLTLNFSEPFVSNFEGGSDTEAALINAITRTAGGFSEIQRVQILVEGEAVETIGEHIETMSPLPVSRE